MHDVESSVHCGEAVAESQAQANSNVLVEKEVRNRLTESQEANDSKIHRLAAYRTTKSVTKAAKMCGIGKDAMKQTLLAERSAKGLKDIRELYADSECDFNVGTNAATGPTTSQLLKLAEQQNFKCAISGVALTPQSAALDHVVSVADGGTHDISNLQWLDSVGIAHTFAKLSATRWVDTLSAKWTMSLRSGLRCSPCGRLPHSPLRAFVRNC